MSDGSTRIMLNTRLDPGVQLNDTYEIDERIASGGMGEVYRGHNIQTGEPVAIKTILPEFADNEAISALFKREATTLGRLHHETIVRYYTFSRDPRLGRTYLAMEFVEGISLAERIRQAPLTPDEVRRLFIKVSDGLALAHSAGVIHRDLSPDNIILRGDDVGRPTIIDFGIARNANVGDGTLIGGGFAGKFNFVSPEQLGIHNREVDQRSDIYSLGLVVAAALRGEPIDMGGSHVEVIEKRSRLPDLSDIGQNLRPLVEAMLQPDPDQRPADAGAVSEWLVATSPDARTAAPGGAAIALTRPGVQDAGPGSRTGAPFATAEPVSPSSATQLIGGVAASAPPAGAPNAVGESPFVSAPVSAAPSQIGAGATPTSDPGAFPAQAASAPAPAKATLSGRYAVIGGALLVLAAGGGAYMTGIIGPASDGGGIEQGAGDGAADQNADGGSGSAQNTDQATETPQDGAKSPEHDDIGDAIEDALGNDTGTGSGNAGPSGAKAGGGTTGETGGQQTAIDGAGGSQHTGTEGGDDTTPDGGTGITEISTDKTGDGVNEVDGPDIETQETTDGLTRTVDGGVAWLRQYDGGPCFFIAVTSVTDKTLTAKGFGRDTPAFQKLYNSFLSANDFDPVINGHPVKEAQCAAVDFLKAIRPDAKDNPKLEIASDRLKTGDTLNVTVDKTGARKLDLLLVDADGFVHNMKSFSKEVDAGGKSSFDIKLGGNRIEPDSPQMVIALTSPNGLAVPEGANQARAADLFPRLGREIEVMKSSVGVDFGYFLLSP